jgi:hypothetical protein
MPDRIVPVDEPVTMLLGAFLISPKATRVDNPPQTAKVGQLSNTGEVHIESQ